MMRLLRSIGLFTCAALCGACGPGGNPDESDAPCKLESGRTCMYLGTGSEGYNGDGLDRLDTEIYWSMDMLFSRDGTPWFIDWNNHLVRKVLPDDTVTTVVGWTDPLFPGDGTGDMSEKSAEGADGTLVKLNHPTDFAEAPDGGVLLMAWHNHKLRRIDPETGKVTIIAGGGAGFAGDGGPMGKALFKQPKALVADGDGNLYISDQQNFRVRRVDAEGTITTLVGNGTKGSAGDGGPAVDCELDWEAGSNPEPSGGLALADGKLYIAETLANRIRVVDLESGVIETLAGTGDAGYTGDGGAALEATFNAPRDLEIGPEGDLYVADTDNSVIRAIDLASGEVRTVVGSGEVGNEAVDGKLATEIKLRRPFGLEFDANGNLFVMDTLNSRILEVGR